jgi:NADH oxidase (H2O2-forming)
MTGRMAQRIGGDKIVEYVELKGGDRLEADAVVLGIGVRANTKLAEKAGLKIGETKAIRVNEYQQTSDENVFAVGDCAEKKSLITGKFVPLRLASIAAREARIAAANLFKTLTITDLEGRNEGVVGTFSTIIGDLALGAVGLTETQAKEAEIAIVTSSATTKDKHPAAMPGCQEVLAKLVFNKKGTLIGGQVVGGASVGEMVNIIAAMIQNRMSAAEIVKVQVGTHPALTPSPIAYPIVEAAAVANTHF